MYSEVAPCAIHQLGEGATPCLIQRKVGRDTAT
jgi:hypothetical protein